MEDKKVETNSQRDVRVLGEMSDVMRGMDLASALGITCNIAGQLLAAMAPGDPGALKKNWDQAAGIMKKSAINKMIYDDEQRRQKKDEK